MHKAGLWFERSGDRVIFLVQQSFLPTSIHHAVQQDFWSLCSASAIYQACSYAPRLVYS